MSSSDPAGTYGSLRVWQEASFEYVDVLDFVRGRDARAEILAMHAPPLVIVDSVRMEREAPARPAMTQ